MEMEFDTAQEAKILQNIIDEYIRGIREVIYDNYTIKDSVKNYLGRGRARKSSLHEEFYYSVEKEVARLAEIFEDNPDEDEACSAVSTILYYGREDFKGLEDNMRLAFISIEALSIPLLPFIKQEDAKKLSEDYALRYPAKVRLPKQNELYYALLERAGEKAKKRWHPSDVFNDNHFFEKHGIKIPRPKGVKRK